MTSCGNCGRPLPPPSGGRGQPRKYCSSPCRVAAYKRRMAGEPVAAAAPRGPWVVDGLEAFIGRLMEEAA